MIAVPTGVETGIKGYTAAISIPAQAHGIQFLTESTIPCLQVFHL
jgi:hypothetical protein